MKDKDDYDFAVRMKQKPGEMFSSVDWFEVIEVLVKEIAGKMDLNVIELVRLRFDLLNEAHNHLVRELESLAAIESGYLKEFGEMGLIEQDEDGDWIA